MRRLLLSTLFVMLTFKKVELYGGFRNFYGFPELDTCQPGPKGRVPWILHVRDSDYGWKDHTARAIIALAVNDYFDVNKKTTTEIGDIKKMTLQLELEITRSLFRNRTHQIPDSDLALYIHALLAINKNPRNFHGTDLVADLHHRVRNESRRVNPFLLLALCNSHVIHYNDIIKLREIAEKSHYMTDGHPDVDSSFVQMKALAYKALACAINYEPKLKNNVIDDLMNTITNCLHNKYNEKEGHFGNAYTTSLAVQAFTAVPDPPDWWDKSKSIEYLKRESEIDVNLIKAYYIEMALNARKYKFIREFYKGVPDPGTSLLPNTYYMQYTIKKEQLPDLFPSLTLKVKSGTNFYEVMKIASNYSAAFNFTSYVNQNGDPMVYSVSGIPNDIEENKFWKLCREYAVNHNDHTSIIDPVIESPKKFFPKEYDHMIYMYSSADCPKRLTTP